MAMNEVRGQIPSTYPRLTGKKVLMLLMFSRVHISDVKVCHRHS